MQVSRDAEGRSECVPRLHGPCRAPASGLAGQDSGELRAGHFSCEVERDSPGYQHHSDSMNRAARGAAALLLLGPATLAAQPADDSHTPPSTLPAAPSPRLHSDGRVTLALHAPDPL